MPCVPQLLDVILAEFPKSFESYFESHYCSAIASADYPHKNSDKGGGGG